MELPRGGHHRLGADRLLRHHERAAAERRADRVDEQSVSERLVADVGQLARPAHGHGWRHLFRRSEQGRAARAAVFRRPAARTGGWHERERRLHRPHRLEPQLGRIVEHLDQHQPDRSEIPEPADLDDDAGAEPVLRGRGRRIDARLARHD